MTWQVRNLRKRPELNGAMGEVVSFNQRKGRCVRPTFRDLTLPCFALPSRATLRRAWPTILVVPCLPLLFVQVSHSLEPF